VTDSPVFDTPMGPRALGRDTPATVAHWDRLVATIPTAPRVFRDAGQPVPDHSPNIRRFFYARFRSQRQRGFCVGANTSGTIMTLLRIPPGASETAGDPLPEVGLSMLFTYDASRMEASREGINLGGGDGSIGSCAIKASHSMGVCIDDLDPDTPALIDSHRNNSTPPQAARDFGVIHPVREFAIADSWDHGLELNAAGFPMAICSDIPSGMMRTDASGFFRMTGGVVGGHCYQLLDHDKAKDLAWIGQCWPQWGERSSDPAYAGRGGFTQLGTCPLSELERWFSPRAMSNGSGEMCVANTVDGFAPKMLDLGSWA
jgi:hypothetical protein